MTDLRGSLGSPLCYLLSRTGVSAALQQVLRAACQHTYPCTTPPPASQVIIPSSCPLASSRVVRISFGRPLADCRRGGAWLCGVPWQLQRMQPAGRQRSRAEATISSISKTYWPGGAPAAKLVTRVDRAVAVDGCALPPRATPPLDERWQRLKAVRRAGRLDERSGGPRRARPPPFASCRCRMSLLRIATAGEVESMNSCDRR